MSDLALRDLTWHHSIGHLLESLDQPNFWSALVRLLNQHVPFDSWVALLFSAGRPQVLAESPAADGAPDTLFQDYCRGLYLLDPFYLASRDSARNGLLRLADVAPDHFTGTEYYQRYFRLNVVADEVQFNLALGDGRTLCLSLGSRQPFDSERLALLYLVQPWVLATMRQRLYFERDLLQQPAPAPDWQERLEHMSAQSQSALTSREMEIARLMLGGHSGKQIALRLQISGETVKVHRKHLYAKLGIKSQSELFALFLQAQS